MILRTSYFYQIRNFKRNMIPVSTAIWDPKYFHDFTGDYNYLFKDKRGIINGLRMLPIIECGRAAQSCKGPESCCYTSSVPACPFLESYRANLEQLNINTLINNFNYLASAYQKHENINDEIAIVLIVYETPKNPCSERQALINYFTSNGIDCRELEYPIS